MSYELNTSFQFQVIRVFFRFLFLVPLLILAIDGIDPLNSRINRNKLWSGTFPLPPPYPAPLRTKLIRLLQKRFIGDDSWNRMYRFQCYYYSCKFSLLIFWYGLIINTPTRA